MAEIDVRASERRFRGGKNDLTSTVHYHRVAAAGTQLPASVRGLWSPFKNGGGGVGDGVCNVGSRGEGRGMLPDSKQPTVRPESWRTTVTRTTFPKEP